MSSPPIALVRVYYKHGVYKTLVVNDDTTCRELILRFAEKMRIQGKPRTLDHFGLFIYEGETGVRRVKSDEPLLRVVQRWQLDHNYRFVFRIKEKSRKRLARRKTDFSSRKFNDIYNIVQVPDRPPSKKKHPSKQHSSSAKSSSSIAVGTIIGGSSGGTNTTPTKTPPPPSSRTKSPTSAILSRWPSPPARPPPKPAYLTSSFSCSSLVQSPSSPTSTSAKWTRASVISRSEPDMTRSLEPATVRVGINRANTVRVVPTSFLIQQMSQWDESDDDQDDDDDEEEEIKDIDSIFQQSEGDADDLDEVMAVLEKLSMG